MHAHSAAVLHDKTLSNLSVSLVHPALTTQNFPVNESSALLCQLAGTQRFLWWCLPLTFNKLY
jgi:hypothetical protein